MMRLNTHESYKEGVAKISELAPAGFVAGFNFRWAGPEQFVNEFPKHWAELYEAKNYYMFDPVFYWSLGNTGYRRWSEIKLPDPMGIRQKSAKYGLVYGTMFSCVTNGKRSSLSAARSDRELSDEENLAIEEIFLSWVRVTSSRPSLSVGQLQVLKCLRDGMGQKETSDALGISEATVSQRARSAMRALRARTRAEAVALAVEFKYFDNPS